MSTFPLEIFFFIFSLLPSRDLPSVIRLSKDFVDFGRSLLYQSVDLRSDDLNIQSTVILLQRDTELRKNIKRATLITRHARIVPSWIPANILNGWNNLRSLNLVGLPFHSIEDQEIFRSSLVRLCLSGALSNLTYQPGANAFPGYDFGIPGLKRLSWKTERATPLESQIISVMKSTLKTLTHISFTGYLSLRETTCYYDFLNLRFPFLTSLELGSLINTTSEERSNGAITRFIIHHPNIHHLSLGKFRTGFTSFQFDESLLTVNSLPKLRSFEGFPKNITLLAHCNVQSLLELNALSLSSDLQDLPMMFQAVEEKLVCGNFPHVRTLRFEFHKDLSHLLMTTHISDLEHQHWIDRFSQICPAVVNWYGTLDPVNRDGLANAFRLYDNLETINLPRISLTLNMPIQNSTIDYYFRTIAERSPNLRKVVARKPAYTELEDCVFYLRRGINDHLDSVCVFDGTEDEWNLVYGEE